MTSKKTSYSESEDLNSDEDDNDNFMVIASETNDNSSSGESEDDSEPVIAASAGTSAEGTSSEGTSAEGTSSEGTSAEGTSAEGTSAEGTAAESISGASENDGSPYSKKHIYRWRHRNIPMNNVPFHEDKEDIQELKTNLEYFKLFWNDELINLLAEQTNLYSTQKTGFSVNTNKDEIEQFLEINITMGIIQLPSYAMYWSQKMRHPPIADEMSLKRYEALRRVLHFVDNATSDQQTSRKLFKSSQSLRA